MVSWMISVYPSRTIASILLGLLSSEQLLQKGLVRPFKEVNVLDLKGKVIMLKEWSAYLLWKHQKTSIIRITFKEIFLKPMWTCNSL